MSIDFPNSENLEIPFINISTSEIGNDPQLMKEEHLLEVLNDLIKKIDFTKKDAFCGVPSDPSFGFFSMASRYWLASLCIYFCGLANCFLERGVGHIEPWLYNARHSIELYLKGFLMFAKWFEILQENYMAPGDQTQSEVRKQHELKRLYTNYENKLKCINKSWNSGILPSSPDLKKLTLSKSAVTILEEIDKADLKSCRFRYPSLTLKNEEEKLQELSFNENDKKLMPITGLPIEPGIKFSHIKTMNGIHRLVHEMNFISKRLMAIWDTIGTIQDDLKNEMPLYYEDLINEI